MEQDFTPFVVYGPSKSGTTWLQKTLDSHPEVRCHFQLQVFPFLNEINKVAIRGNAVYSRLKSPFKGVFPSAEDERKYWVKLRYFQNMRRALDRSIEELRPMFPKPEDQEYLEELVLETYRATVPKFVIDQPGKKVYGLKSTTDLEFMFKVYPKAKVITIIRDGRDVATSKRFHMQKRGAFFHGDEKSPFLYALNSNKWTKKLAFGLRHYLGWFGEDHFKTYNNDNMKFTEASLKKFSRDWYLTTSFILKFQKQFPEQFLVVRYEDMKQRQGETLAAIFAFLGVRSDEDVLKEVMDATDFKKLKSNQKDSFFRKGALGDWQNYFTEADKRLFKQQTEDLLIELGYAKDQNW